MSNEEISYNEPCPCCAGTGLVDGDYVKEPCINCHGNGRIRYTKPQRDSVKAARGAKYELIATFRPTDADAWHDFEVKILEITGHKHGDFLNRFHTRVCQRTPRLPRPVIRHSIRAKDGNGFWSPVIGPQDILTHRLYRHADEPVETFE